MVLWLCGSLVFVYVFCYRVEDFDEFTQIFAERTKELSNTERLHFLAELSEAPAEDKHAAVCEVCSHSYPFAYLHALFFLSGAFLISVDEFGKVTHSIY